MSRFEPYWTKYASREKNARFTVTHFIQIMIVFAGLSIILMRWNSVELQSRHFDWDEQQLTIKEPWGSAFTVLYDDILSINLREVKDYGAYVKGMDTDNTCYGIWHNDEFGDYRLYIQKAIPLDLVITTASDTIVLNLESEDVTRQLYDQILGYMNS